MLSSHCGVWAATLGDPVVQEGHLPTKLLFNHLSSPALKKNQLHFQLKFISNFVVNSAYRILGFLRMFSCIWNLTVLCACSPTSRSSFLPTALSQSSVLFSHSIRYLLLLRLLLEGQCAYQEGLVAVSKECIHSTLAGHPSQDILVTRRKIL